MPRPRPQGDKAVPFIAADERRTLLDFLDYLREAVVRKASDLPEEEARRALVPSGTSLLGLVKHLTRVEVAWFQWAFAGLDVHVPGDDVADGERRADVVAAYRDAGARSNAIAGACEDLTTLCRRPGPAPTAMTMRWVLVHMVEETARHAGHADILREQLDGSIGR